MTTASGATVDRVGQAWEALSGPGANGPGRGVRRVRRNGGEPLPFLYDVHPEARSRTSGRRGPRDDRRRGHRRHGGRRRRAARRRLPSPEAVPWQELASALAAAPQAHDQARDAPADRRREIRRRYWVVDGHNRVALALYTGQVGIDANVVELVRRVRAAPSRSSRSRPRSPRRRPSGPRARPSRRVSCSAQEDAVSDREPPATIGRMTDGSPSVWPDARPFEGVTAEADPLLAGVGAVDPDPRPPDQSRTDRQGGRDRRVRRPRTRLPRLPR